MTPSWGNLKGSEYVAFRAARAFLNGRLEQRETIDWALYLKSSDAAKRAAILDLLGTFKSEVLSEPWLTAWRLIQESWESPAIESHNSSKLFEIKQKLIQGERSAVLVKAIVELVFPRLSVGTISGWQLEIKKPPKRPRKFEDLLSASLKSGEVVDPRELGVSTISDLSFLVSLAHELDAAVIAGLDIARRIGWDEKRRPWQIGLLYRVYYVPKAERPPDDHEPDEFHQGMAPSVKLLHSVVSRLGELDSRATVEFADRWRQLGSSIHLRLWAALSRSPQLSSAKDVAAFLLSLDDAVFWNQNSFPEIAELRARRFAEFDPADQVAITARLRKLPPRRQWPKELEKANVEKARHYWAARELRRIEMAGGELSKFNGDWLQEQIYQFPELANMARIDDGFMGMKKARWVAPNPDARYDALVGEERLRALETALASTLRGWEAGPAGGASDWIQKQGNQLAIIADFEAASNASSDFSLVWERFGWAHSPAPGPNDANEPPRDLAAEADRVLALLEKLSEKTIYQAIDGISHWLSTWEKQVVINRRGLIVWLKVWPIAVEATNSNKPAVDDVDFNAPIQSVSDSEPLDLDTLNTSVGKLVGVFLAACPSVKSGEHPFQENAIQTQMRGAIENSIGPSGLIVQYRLIETLFYFINADLEWTLAHLIPPLLIDSKDALVLWRAVGRRTRFSQELKIIGDAMSERAIDLRLGRETRQSLVFSLIVECLHSLHGKQLPAVSYAQITQMIRSLDDEVRAHGAGVIQRFVQERAAKIPGHPLPPTREELFRSAGKPFLQNVWPQERSLSTPGVSKALADLPATAGEEFVDAVTVIERFLVPFDCWSILDYGFYGEEDGRPKLSRIDDEAKAAAFLLLLDRTVGDTETAVVPIDLGDALDQVRKVSPNQVETQMFRRLATASRRA